MIVLIVWTWFVLQVAEVGHLDDEIMALHSEIVELQRSPYARRQGDKMEQLWVLHSHLHSSISIFCICYSYSLMLYIIISGLWLCPEQTFFFFFFLMPGKVSAPTTKTHGLFFFFICSRSHFYFVTLTNFFYFREEKAVELYKQMKMKCKSKTRSHLF